MVVLKPIRSKADWKTFIDLPWQIYEKQSHWIPPLRAVVQETLDVNKNPFFKHAYLHPLIAMDGDRPVGRIVGVIDENYNKTHKETTAFFGFFECVDDQSVADLMLNEVKRWSERWGMNKVLGPVNPCTTDEMGLLVDGFETDPTVMTTYNPPYYAKLLESWGCRKAMDCYGYRFVPSTQFNKRIIKHIDRLKEKPNIKIRTIRKETFNEDANEILEIYEDAWKRNWGYVALTEDERKAFVDKFKPIHDPELVILVEVDGKIAGFALALPDVNQVFSKIPSGKLLPTGIFTLLWNLKGPGRRKTVSRVRIVALGIKEEYEKLGLGPLLYKQVYDNGVRRGYVEGESSWILENNKPMVKALEMMNAERSKTWRLYDRVF